MATRGKGPKDVFVKRYSRWKAGKREQVRDAHRAAAYRLSLRRSKDQLVFGFYQSGPA
ncbi:hypothetical protein SAMN05192541_14534 [Bradyrhizobium arachidis]|nr:hypothetical protein SAMN05192541_14534 [Bradyrhizobium arachidis]